MNDKTVQLTRQQLYDLVWSKPMRQVAIEYNLSDVGLAKICKRHNIPRPPVGYWMKLEHGYQPQRDPLVTSSSHDEDVIEIRNASLADEELPLGADAEAFRNLQKEIDAMDQRKHGDKTHPLLGRTKEALGKGSANQYGLQEPWRDGCIDISVARASFGRSIGIMSNLFHMWEARGFKVEIREQGYRGTYVWILDEDIKICLRENTKRIESPGWNPTSALSGRYEFRPTGKLSFRITNFYHGNIQKVWNDTESEPLETKLLEISKGIIEAAYQLHLARLRREAEDQKRQELLRVQQEKEEQVRREHARFDKLLKDCEDWRKSQAIRTYIEEVRKAQIAESSDPKKLEELQEWIDWAMKQADLLDPIRKDPIAR